MMRRSDGLRKVCGCRSRVWAKCAHPWHLTFRWQGGRYRFSLDRYLGRPVSSKTAAEALRDEIRAAIRAGTFRMERRATCPLSVDDLVRLYLETLTPAAAKRERWHRTVISRARVVGADGLELAFGTFVLTDVTTAVLERFRAARLAQPRILVVQQQPVARPTGPVAVSRNIRFLRAAWNWAIRMGHLETTPFLRFGQPVIRTPKEPGRRRRLQPGEYQRLLEACGVHLRALVDAAIESGCRRGELLSLQWSQVTLGVKPTLMIPASKAKTREDRWVPISRRLAGVLEMRWHAPDGRHLPPDAYVFGNEIGERVQSIKTAWTLACRRATIAGLHFHDLRREAGSRWLEGGVPLSTVRDWLGHTNIAQTSTYLAAALQGAHEDMARYDRRQKPTSLAQMGKLWAKSGSRVGRSREVSH